MQMEILLGQMGSSEGPKGPVYINTGKRVNDKLVSKVKVSFRQVLVSISENVAHESLNLHKLKCLCLEYPPDICRLSVLSLIEIDK